PSRGFLQPAVRGSRRGHLANAWYAGIAPTGVGRHPSHQRDRTALRTPLPGGRDAAWHLCVGIRATAVRERRRRRNSAHPVSAVGRSQTLARHAFTPEPDWRGRSTARRCRGRERRGSTRGRAAGDGVAGRVPERAVAVPREALLRRFGILHLA